MRERRFIRLLAYLDAIGGIAALILNPFQVRVCAFTILGLVSIWLLRPPQKPKLATT
jgi:membrane protein implicated in regulation of membrane protease activity